MVNFKLFAIRLGEKVKYEKSINEINRIANAIFDFDVVEHPNDNITSERAQLIYDWIMTLKEQSIDDQEKLHLLKEFEEELGPNTLELHSYIEPKSELRAFLSYSTVDKTLGARIKSILERFDIKSFLAHDDIEISEEWRTRILSELNKVDIFIAILSENFKDSEWCSQEAGIALFRDEIEDDILIIPLSTDGTKSYGFIGKYQSKKIDTEEELIKYLIRPIVTNFPEIDFISSLIEELKSSASWRYSEGVMGVLEPHFGNLTYSQVNTIADYSIENYEVYSANLCYKKYIPKFLKINKRIIEKAKFDRLSDLIRNQ